MRCNRQAVLIPHHYAQYSKLPGLFHERGQLADRIEKEVRMKREEFVAGSVAVPYCGARDSRSFGGEYIVDAVADHES